MNADDIALLNTSNLSTITSTIPGLFKEDLLRVKTEDELPESLAQQIDGILSQLCSNLLEEEINQLLAQLLDIVLGYEPQNFTEYVWYLKLTCIIILLNDFPLELCVKQSQLISHIEPDESWSTCPVKIHIIAETIFNLIENDYNLAFVVREIFDLNRLNRYVVLSIIWAAIRRFQQKENKMFRLYKITDVISVLDSIPLKNLENNLPSIHKILTFVSMLINYVICQKSTEDDVDAFKYLFVCTANDIDKIKDKLNKIKYDLNILINRTKNVDAIQVDLLIKTDALYLLEYGEVPGNNMLFS